MSEKLLPAGVSLEDDESFHCDKHSDETASFKVAAEESGQRVDLVLSGRYPDFSRSQLSRLAKEGLVKAAGRPVKPGFIVSEGQLVELPRPKQPPTKLLGPEPQIKLDILYEDQYILVLNKPWGLVVHPGLVYSGPTLAGGLLAYNPALSEVGESNRPGLVHRLDKDTSGVLVTAKTAESLSELSGLFSRRETLKSYLAFTKGVPSARSGLIDRPIGRHLTQRHKMAAGVPGGREAFTKYKVIAFFPKTNISLLRLKILTGRTHQIRVHLQSLGVPVLGDMLYSRGTADLTNRFPALKPLIERQLLHARRLTIVHPSNKQPMTFRAPWPADFLSLLNTLMAIERQP